MPGALTSHREDCIYQARVYLQQARAFRLRRAASNGGDAMSMHESGWFFDLLSFASGRREAASVIVPSRWWRCPSGLVFRVDGGFNGVMLCYVPCFKSGDKLGLWYGVNSFTVGLKKLRAFLDRCEALGDKEPTDLLRLQVARLEGSHRWDRLGWIRPKAEEQDGLPVQADLFA